VELSTEYIIQQFYTYCKRPIYKKGQGVYNAECPVCKEGTSAGVKRRLFYFPDDHYFYCFNCSKSWTEFNWLREVTSDTPASILKNSKTHVVDLTERVFDEVEVVSTFVNDTLPGDAIDITDQQQLAHIKTNNTQKGRVLENVLEYCTERRLTTAINKPKGLYYTFNDRVHANRLIIPFYNEGGKLFTYQSRSLRGDTFPKYITKVGEKCLFGEDTVSDNIPYIFVLEGPIDSMFIRNGVGVGGSTITERQSQFLHKHFDKQIIYIFDNDKDNPEMKKTVLKAIKAGKTVFIWPKELKQFKDVNEVCCHYKIDLIKEDYIVKNSFTGLEAEVKFRTSLH